MSAARAAMSASAATSALTGLCARGARRVPRRGASAVPRAVPSKDRSDVDAASKRKPPPSVIVGGLFVAEAPQADDDARAGSDRRVSTSAGRLPNGESESRSDVPDDHDETRRAKARVQTLETTALANEAIAMWLGAAILGPLLDHQHSRFDVLHYEPKRRETPTASAANWFDSSSNARRACSRRRGGSRLCSGARAW